MSLGSIIGKYAEQYTPPRVERHYNHPPHHRDTDIDIEPVILRRQKRMPVYPGKVY